MSHRLILAILLGSAAVPAQALTITFEGQGNNFQPAQAYSGYDFNFTTSGWGVFDDSFDPGLYTSNGTARLILSGGTPGRVRISQQGGGLFSLNGADVAVGIVGAQGGMTVTGTFADLTTVSTSFDVGASFQSRQFAGFTNLIAVTFAEREQVGFGAYGIGVDNIVIDQAVVPEPATWAMMIAGFGLVGAGLRRRKAAIAFA
jgi:hypothetical protein